VLVIDPVSLMTTGTIPLPGTPTSEWVSGTTLLVGVQTGELLYFDTGTSQQTNSVAVPQNSLVFAVSSDGSRIYLEATSSTGGGTTVEILDFSTGKVLKSQNFPNLYPPDIYTSYFLLSPDEMQIVGTVEPVLLIDAGTLKATKAIESLGPFSAAAWLNTDTLLMLYGEGGGVAAINQSGSLSTIIPVGDPLQTATGLAAYPAEAADPKRGVVYAGAGSVPDVIGGKQNRVIASLPAPVAFEPGAVAGGKIYGLAPNAEQAFYDLKTGQTSYLPPLPGRSSTSPGVATPDGKMYWVPATVYKVPGLGQREVAIYNTTTNTLIGQITPPNGNIPIVFSPDSTTAYIGSSYGGTIAVYDTRTLQNTHTYSYPTMNMALIAVSPDGTMLYGSDGTAVYVLDAASGAQKQSFPLPASLSPAGGMAISSDSTTLFLTAYGASFVYLVNTASGQVTQVALPNNFASGVVVLLPGN
jgi:hypothetical protein